MKMLLAGIAVLSMLSASTANACAPDVCDGTYVPTKPYPADQPVWKPRIPQRGNELERPWHRGRDLYVDVEGRYSLPVPDPGLSAFVPRIPTPIQECYPKWLVGGGWC
jgi:hypothetical protein